MTAAVEVSGLAHDFGGAPVLAGVDLTIGAGEYAVLLGPSGCGKTTLLAILGGFLSPRAGRVVIGGRDVTALPARVRPTTTMFQDYALFPHLTCAQNVGFGLRMRGVARAARAARAARMLALVGLEGAATRRPHELSGGQRQRVALARALAVEPAVLLLDEPLGALDLSLRRQMQGELKAIQAQLGTTFIHVTHDQEEAMALADRLILLRGGRIEDQGPPQRLYARPATRFTAAFMGEINLIEVVVQQVDGARIGLATPFGRVDVPLAGAPFVPAQGARLTIGIRPEHLAPHPGAAHAPAARLLGATYLGAHIRAEVAVGDTRLIVALPGDAGPGAELRLGLDPARIILLPAP